MEKPKFIKREISNIEAERHLKRQELVDKKRERWTDGKEFERHVFGKTTIAKQAGFSAYQEKEREIMGQHGAPGRSLSNYRVASLIKLFKRSYAGDPEEPETEYISELRIAIAEQLNLRTTEEMSRLKFYNSLETALDIKKGWDSFIEYDDGKKTFRVPLDATLDPEMEKKKFIDKEFVIINLLDVPNPEENFDDYEDRLNSKAKEIIESIEEQKKRAKAQQRKKYRAVGFEESLVTAGRKRQGKIREYRP